MDNLKKKKSHYDIERQEVCDHQTKITPFLRWNFKFDECTGREKFESVELSDDSPITENKLKTAIKNATGTSHLPLAEKILNKTARGIAGEGLSNRLNEASAMLAALQPQNETEALLFGQFLALQNSGFNCLRLANLPEQKPYYVEKLFALANKLLNTANQTMQTVMKYRNGGKQTVQVVHMHNEGQAIVAQNVSPQTEGD